MFNTSQMGAGVGSPIGVGMRDESSTLEPLNEKFLWDESIKYSWEKDLKYKNSKDRKLNFIIPIRDREKDLEHLISNLKIILEYQKIQYRIYIIEQSFSKKFFNKGKIINAAFKESLKDDFSDTYIIHDVDNIPLTQNIINYYNEDDLKCLYGDHWCLGCIFSVSKNVFKRVNGFSNSYWGWGFEDTDFQKRNEFFNISFNKEQMIGRRKTNLIKDIENWSDEKRLYFDPVANNWFTGDNVDKMTNLHFFDKIWWSRKPDAEILKIVKRDGLKNCTYKIVDQYLYQNNKNIIRTIIKI